MTSTNGDAMWAALAAPLPAEAMSFRLDGKPAQRDGKYFARFVWYYEWPTLLRRLDEAAAGQWSVYLQPLPAAADKDGLPVYAFTCRLAVGDVVREDVGEGDSVKSAATDAMKRAARQFGVGLEAWEVEGQLWVQVDGEGKYAKAVEDPAAAFQRMLRKQKQDWSDRQPAPARREAPEAPVRVVGTHDAARSEAAVERAANAPDPYAEIPECCGKPCWDNRENKRNPKSPDFVCKTNREHVVWLGRDGKKGTDKRPDPKAKAEITMGNIPEMDDEPVPF